MAASAAAAARGALWAVLLALATLQTATAFEPFLSGLVAAPYTPFNRSAVAVVARAATFTCCGLLCVLHLLAMTAGLHWAPCRRWPSTFWTAEWNTHL